MRKDMAVRLEKRGSGMGRGILALVEVTSPCAEHGAQTAVAKDSHSGFMYRLGKRVNQADGGLAGMIHA
jgi:hypothetical protein